MTAAGRYFQAPATLCLSEGQHHQSSSIKPNSIRTTVLNYEDYLIR